MGTIWCFGDSNTYGYDPCGFFGGRYAAPWPELLAEKTGLRVIIDYGYRYLGDIVNYGGGTDHLYVKEPEDRP